MDELSGKVAVVTGGASGIGRAMAERFAAEGMKIVLADIEEEALAATADDISATGATVLAVATNVADWDAVDALARRCYEELGAAHIVCNNAGVGVGRPPSELTLEDWSWVLGVNLWGVIHGIRAFVPRMRASGEPGHIVNTASVAGLASPPARSAAYGVSKFGVVALSEALYAELRDDGSDIGVSVLCPGFVQTRLGDASRNRPTELGGPQASPTPAGGGPTQRPTATAPEGVADAVVAAIRAGDFWILTHRELDPYIRTRVDRLLYGLTPDDWASAIARDSA